MTATRARVAPSSGSLLQRHEQEEDREHEIGPGPKQNVLPPQDANELRPQRSPPLARAVHAASGK